jgi:hypothetical protein
MRRTDLIRFGSLGLLGGIATISACSVEQAPVAGTQAPGSADCDVTLDCSSVDGGATEGPSSIARDAGIGDAVASDAGAATPDAATPPDAATEAGCGANCAEAGTDSAASDAGVSTDAGVDASGVGIRDGDETDVDCGGPNAPKCAEGKACLVDGDCVVACNYQKRCIMAPSCAPHLGGDTCGKGEVGTVGTQHESCCKSLPVVGFADGAHPGTTVYLDKYEITAGRIRAFVDAVAKANGGVPNVKAWIAAHPPLIWDAAWDVFLPSGYEGDTKIIGRRLLGDPRPEDSGNQGPPGPGVILPPATDQARNMGINFQFGSQVYVDLHGNNCGTFAGAYGFPTYFYPGAILARDNQLPRANGTGAGGLLVPAAEALDVKAVNCITNAMLVAFCHWDGGQLATDEVLDFVTATPPTLGNVSGCGTQYDNHGELLGNKFTHTVQTGGRCAPVALVNATFDGGDVLPVLNSPLNVHNYRYPNLGSVNHDKAWEISAPGRASTAAAALGQPVDMVRINAGDEPWMDLHGNLSEAALDMTGGVFTGLFALKYRGIAYGSSRSDLNVKPLKGESVLRIQRPEAKAAFSGGRCVRFQ